MTHVAISMHPSSHGRFRLRAVIAITKLCQWCFWLTLIACTVKALGQISNTCLIGLIGPVERFEYLSFPIYFSMPNQWKREFIGQTVLTYINTFWEYIRPWRYWHHHAICHNKIFKIPKHQISLSCLKNDKSSCQFFGHCLCQAVWIILHT